MSDSDKPAAPGAGSGTTKPTPQPSGILPISPGAAASMSAGAKPLRDRPGKQRKRRPVRTKVGKKTNELLRHPLALPMIALLAGLLAARVLLGVIPLRGALELDLPMQLAAWLSESGDNRLVIARPHALWLMPTVVLPFLIVMATRTLVDVRPFQVVLQVLVRLLVLMAIALGLSQPSLQSPIRGKTVVFVVDTSESIDAEQLAGAEQLVRQAMTLADDEEAAGVEREDRTRVRLVTYAGRANVIELGPNLNPDDLRIGRDPDNALASDHASAMRLAEALLDPDTEGRVVLVTDATGDLSEREGLGQAIFDLEDRGVAVHTRSFPATVRGDVLIEAVHLPKELRVSQSFEVAIDIVATKAGKVRLSLDKDGKPNAMDPSRDIELRPGRQQIKMAARVTEPGPVLFEARLDTAEIAKEDNRSEINDKAAVVGEVVGRPRVLLVSADASAALSRALGSNHLSVDTVAPNGLPAGAEGLRKYDLVVFHDIPSRWITPEQEAGVVRYVKDAGGGFIMIGGENSFGVGGWGGSTIEEVLPVRFSGERQREQPTLALVLVIDKSGSMSSEDRLDLVKEAARATARALDPHDEIGVVAFDSAPQVLVRLQSASNRLRISSSISRLSAGGGTNAMPALREAYLQLAGSKALVKHVILLSDGESPENGISALLGDMREADITVSSVGVGAGAGKDFLVRVAERGHGRYFFSEDGTDVPRIFSREAREVKRNALVERNLYPRVAKPVQMLRGINFDTAPGLRGIVPVKPKAQSEVILRTHFGDPLLVRSRRGLGRVAAFASDAQPRWAVNWIGWSGFPRLWSQLARDTMRQGAGMMGGAKIKVSPAADPGAWRVVVDVESPEGFANDLSGAVEVIDPSIPEEKGEDGELLDNGRVREVSLELSAPGRYEAVVRDIEAGQRLLEARLFDDSQNPPRLAAEAISHVSVPYPAELSPQTLEPNAEWLAGLVERGTTSGPVDEVVTTPGDANGRTRTKPLWPLVLVWLLLPLLVLDLLLRRVSLGVRKVSV
ncbi:von Willebrand factor type A domain protein [Enhygromyxa salina]|uniref:von Willebrand factor type A domain protein n=1 Tax=Enhygromyxa salina TaxID=215803 RepID=A0A2S9XIG9_9BACT|nr:VWA domain-containing protein [Enhygromyxa salina]PRP92643.1 von Willebrand factor type A domain protein [Enhygromyxa salina]